MKRLTLVTITLPILLCVGCAPKSQQTSTTVSDQRTLSQLSSSSSRFITVKGRKFVDPQGRELILHGTNIVDKSKSHNYLSWHGPEEFAQMREWGFNCIRLGIIWDGVEPEPGRYDDEYLAGVDKRIQWAKENGMYVLLDMHQDLFSAKFGGDGAPDWATLDDGKSHIRGGGIWSMAYFTSPAVHTAFENFWANKPASDGIGIQEHFARAWQHVAERYADEPAVVGYDVFNEPFPGSTVLHTLSLKFRATSDALAKKQGGESPSLVELMQKFAEPDGLASYAEDIELYKVFCDSGTSSSHKFEQTELAQFYNRVAQSIRQVDPNHIIFMETHIFCNAGTPSGIIPIIDRDGDREHLQGFAPHGYDIVTDTKKVANANPDRIELIFEHHAETAERLDLPVLVGEWGALYGSADTLPAAQMVVAQIEKHLFSDTYWSYGSRREMDKAPYFSALAKPYPTAVSGTLISYKSDWENRTFRCVWREDASITAPSLIYLPELWFSGGYSVELDPKSDGWTFEKISDDSSSGYLLISPTGQEVDRRLKLVVSSS